jgi:hypothetical protein
MECGEWVSGANVLSGGVSSSRREAPAMLRSFYSDHVILLPK